MSQYPTNPSSPQTAGAAAAAGSGTLVLIGFGVSLLAVILMNVYVEMRVRANDEDKITFFRFVGEKDSGDEIEIGDLEAFRIPESMATAFGQDAIRENPSKPGSPADGLGWDLNVSVIKGQVLTSSMFLASGRSANRNDPEIGEHQIALSVDSEDQPADLAPGDRIDLYGAIRRSRSTEFMVVMEYVEVAAVGERRSESGDGSRANKYGSITINIDPKDVPKLFDIQQRLPEQEFRISLRSANDTSTPVTGGEAVINPDVLSALGLD